MDDYLHEAGIFYRRSNFRDKPPKHILEVVAGYQTYSKGKPVGAKQYLFVTNKIDAFELVNRWNSMGVTDIYQWTYVITEIS